MTAILTINPCTFASSLLLLLCLATNMPQRTHAIVPSAITSWSIGGNRVPVNRSNWVAGYYPPTHTVWLLGGFDDSNGHGNAVVSFDVASQVFTTHANLAAITSLEATSQSYTVINETFIFFAHNGNIGAFDMQTGTEYFPYKNIVTPVNTTSGYVPCVTQYQNRYLFLVGGSPIYRVGGSVAIYDLHDETWLSPSAQDITQDRKAISCQVVNGHLYVMGGENDTAPYTAYDTIERLDVRGDLTNIQAVNWVTLASTLSRERAYLTSTVIGDNIYMIGGYEYVPVEVVVATVQVLDTRTETLSTNTPSLNELRSGVPVLVIPNIPSDGGLRLYIFGGYDDLYDSYCTDRWEHTNSLFFAEPPPPPQNNAVPENLDVPCVRDPDYKPDEGQTEGGSGGVTNVGSTHFLNTFWRCAGDQQWWFLANHPALSLSMVLLRRHSEQFADWSQHELLAFADQECKRSDSESTHTYAVGADKGYGYIVNAIAGDLPIDFSARLRHACNFGFPHFFEDYCTDSHSVCAVPRQKECQHFYETHKSDAIFAEITIEPNEDTCALVFDTVAIRNKFFEYRQIKNPTLYYDHHLCLFDYFFVCVPIPPTVVNE